MALVIAEGTARWQAGLSGDVVAVVLRPRAIFGVGDQQLFPRLVEALRSRRLPQFGDGNAMADLTSVAL